ncbi:MAG: DivIVA domain-containing protein [Rubrobacteraceae bacterium]|nr:DivIVA domain-containing protein [Rubrobacter sp.]
MAIRPTDVRRKEFKSSLRGYDANQVDDFLDAVADEFERTYSENVRLREESTSLRSRLEQFDELESSIRAALVHAEQAANDLRRTATQEAESVRQTASREAESARQTANREAELTINDAKARSHRMLADTAERVERIQESYHALRNAKQLFASDFRHLLKSYMEVMDNVDVATAREIQSSLRERVDLESIAAARLAAEAERSGVQEELPIEEPVGDSTEEHEPFGEAGDQETQRIDLSPSAGISPSDEASEVEPVTNQEPGSESVTETGDVSPESEPEVEEPEVEPSTAEDSSGESASAEEPVSEAPETEAPETEAPGTSEQDEATLARDSGSHEFWEDAERKDASGNGEEGRISRASRFLRRRG